jgi:fimbrial isopeptide formation D2 family protein
MFMLLAGVLVALPVERAAADGLELGPDGYFSTLIAGATPAASSGWASTRRIVFGKQGSSGTYDSKQVSGGYKTLAKGAVASVPNADFGVNQSYSKSSTTSVAENEALLWADNVVTGGFPFASGSSCSSYPCNSFDAATGSYKSNPAQVSVDVGVKNYSVFERSLLRLDKVEGVCTAAQSTGCGGGSYTQQTSSVNKYNVFPLSIGDVNKYFGHASGWVTDTNLACPANSCANGADGFWLRSARWHYSYSAFAVREDGDPTYGIRYTGFGLRPAVRLNLDNLLLSAASGNQGQSASGDLRLTFVEAGKKLTTWEGSVTDESGLHTLDLSGSSDLGANLGWKIVDPGKPTEVVASGKTNGNMSLPDSMNETTRYDLYVWSQQDGSATDGLTNKATEPVKATIKGWKVRPVPSYDISLTGTTTGVLTAYRIGDYAETVFDHAGELKSVSLSTPTTPTTLKDTLKNAAIAAGGSNVDTDNPIGWVASQWLGYPTDPLSDDVTSAFSPYAGNLQLFAQELAKQNATALGGEQGHLDAGTYDREPLEVSGPGLYLIVDSSGASLPIIVGTKVFNEALGDDGGFVDFADAGVKGKPRLGQAALKSDFMDVYKRIVNDPGMDGFDVGSEVEYEIALRVPDLTKLDGVVSFGDYVFEVADVLPSGLDVTGTLASVRVFVGDAERTGDASVTLQDGRLTVSGLKALFAVAGSSPVVNDTGVVPVNGVVRIRYAAVLADTALVSRPGVDGLKPNANTVTLTRSKGPALTEDKTATANAYTFTVDVVKLDKDDLSKKLGGVEFEVSRDGALLKFVGSAGVYRLAVGGETGSATVATHTDGTLSLLGVEARELSFKETTAPSGYFRVSDFTVDIRPEWNEDATQVTKVTYATSGTNLAYVSQNGKQVMVLDPAWSLANLPYTGGIGILVLLIVGGLILAFAIRPYILSKRAERDANLV